MNAPFNDPRPTPAARRRGYFALGLTSLVFALAFLPAPLAVLYQLNEEALTTSSWGARHATWDTLHETPALPADGRSTYLLVRTSLVGATLGALFLIAAGVVAFRSRTAGVRMHAVYVAVQVVVMTALVLSAWQFSRALEATNGERDWMLRLPAQSAVRGMAIAVAALGLLYPLVLALLYWRLPRDAE